MTTAYTALDWVKFCKRVGYAKFQHKNDKLTLKWAWSGLRDPFYILTPPMIFMEQLKLESSHDFTYTGVDMISSGKESRAVPLCQLTELSLFVINVSARRGALHYSIVLMIYCVQPSRR